MNSEKYVGPNVHQATISMAGFDSKEKLVMGSILETQAATMLEFLAGLRGTLSVNLKPVSMARRACACCAHQLTGLISLNEDTIAAVTPK